MDVFTTVPPSEPRQPILLICLAMATALALVVGSRMEASLLARQPIPGSRVLVMPFAVEVDPKASRTESAALWLGEAASVLLTDGLSSRGLGVVEPAPEGG